MTIYDTVGSESWRPRGSIVFLMPPTIARRTVNQTIPKFLSDLIEGLINSSLLFVFRVGKQFQLSHARFQR